MRTANIKRKTNETLVEIALNLDGSGEGSAQTGVGFFDHMLDQLIKHSNCDLTIKVSGDLNVDEHHTVEDAGIALGEAFKVALSNKAGITRYGFYLLPMDEALAQIALDFSGRAYLVWSCKFSREKVGDLPTEMVQHFFQSFCQSAGCTLNVSVSGGNTHHMIEAIFKGFAKALRSAVAFDGTSKIPSTKGVL